MVISMSDLKITATLENMEKVQEFIQEKLSKYDVSEKIKSQIDIAVEEIFVNIAHYAYNPNVGEAVIVCNIEEGDSAVVEISFEDWGKPFNPLEKEDVDITLSAEEREIGGLGIYMVKQMMEKVDYKYEDNKNIFTIRKSI